MTDPIPEFSKIVDLTSLAAEGRSYTLAPDEPTRVAIAKRFSIPAILSLMAQVHVSPTKNGALVRGQVTAQLIRECVASLEDMQEAVEEHFQLEFDRDAEELTLEDFETKDAEFLANVAEPLEGTTLDIGELMVQQLSLAMNPFPRKDGVPSLVEEYGTAVETSPFAVLKQPAQDVD